MERGVVSFSLLLLLCFILTVPVAFPAPSFVCANGPTITEGNTNNANDDCIFNPLSDIKLDGGTYYFKSLTIETTLKSEEVDYTGQTYPGPWGEGEPCTEAADLGKGGCGGNEEPSGNGVWTDGGAGGNTGYKGKDGNDHKYCKVPRKGGDVGDSKEPLVLVVAGTLTINAPINLSGLPGKTGENAHVCDEAVKSAGGGGSGGLGGALTVYAASIAFGPAGYITVQGGSGGSGGKGDKGDDCFGCGNPDRGGGGGGGAGGSGGAVAIVLPSPKSFVVNDLVGSSTGEIRIGGGIGGPKPETLIYGADDGGPGPAGVYIQYYDENPLNGNACADGIDNDNDGTTDNQDAFCCPSGVYYSSATATVFAGSPAHSFCFDGAFYAPDTFVEGGKARLDGTAPLTIYSCGSSTVAAPVANKQNVVEKNYGDVQAFSGQSYYCTAQGWTSLSNFPSLCADSIDAAYGSGIYVAPSTSDGSQSSYAIFGENENPPSRFSELCCGISNLLLGTAHTGSFPYTKTFSGVEFICNKGAVDGKLRWYTDPDKETIPASTGPTDLPSDAVRKSGSVCEYKPGTNYEYLLSAGTASNPCCGDDGAVDEGKENQAGSTTYYCSLQGGIYGWKTPKEACQAYVSSYFDSGGPSNLDTFYDAATTQQPIDKCCGLSWDGGAAAFKQEAVPYASPFQVSGGPLYCAQSHRWYADADDEIGLPIATQSICEGVIGGDYLTTATSNPCCGDDGAADKGKASVGGPLYFCTQVGGTYEWMSGREICEDRLNAAGSLFDTQSSYLTSYENTDPIEACCGMKKGELTIVQSNSLPYRRISDKVGSAPSPPDPSFLNSGDKVNPYLCTKSNGKNLWLQDPDAQVVSADQESTSICENLPALSENDAVLAGRYGGVSALDFNRNSLLKCCGDDVADDGKTGAGFICAKSETDGTLSYTWSPAVSAGITQRVYTKSNNLIRDPHFKTLGNERPWVNDGNKISEARINGDQVTTLQLSYAGYPSGSLYQDVLVETGKSYTFYVNVDDISSMSASLIVENAATGSQITSGTLTKGSRSFTFSSGSAQLIRIRFSLSSMGSQARGAFSDLYLIETGKPVVDSKLYSGGVWTDCTPTGSGILAGDSRYLCALQQNMRLIKYCSKTAPATGQLLGYLGNDDLQVYASSYRELGSFGIRFGGGDAYEEYLEHRGLFVKGVNAGGTIVPATNDELSIRVRHPGLFGSLITAVVSKLEFDFYYDTALDSDYRVVCQSGASGSLRILDYSIDGERAQDLHHISMPMSSFVGCNDLRFRPGDGNRDGSVTISGVHLITSSDNYYCDPDTGSGQWVTSRSAGSPALCTQGTQGAAAANRGLGVLYTGASANLCCGDTGYASSSLTYESTAGDAGTGAACCLFNQRLSVGNRNEQGPNAGGNSDQVNLVSTLVRDKQYVCDDVILPSGDDGTQNVALEECTIAKQCAVTAGSTFYCDGSDWNKIESFEQTGTYPTGGIGGTYLKDAPEDIEDASATDAHCCRATQCWNGRFCIDNMAESTYNAGLRKGDNQPFSLSKNHAGDQYVCVLDAQAGTAEWKDAKIKRSFPEKDAAGKTRTSQSFGYCSSDSQCFNADTGGCVEGVTLDDLGAQSTSAPQAFISSENYFCELLPSGKGEWVNKGKYVAHLLHRLGGSTYAVYCSGKEYRNLVAGIPALNLFWPQSEDISGAPASFDALKVSNYGVLFNDVCIYQKKVAGKGQVVVGLSLATDISTFFEDAFNMAGTPICDSGSWSSLVSNAGATFDCRFSGSNRDTIGGLGYVYWDAKKQLLFFSNDNAANVQQSDQTSWFANLINTIKSFFTSEPAILDAARGFIKYSYVTSGSSTVEGIYDIIAQAPTTETTTCSAGSPGSYFTAQGCVNNGFSTPLTVSDQTLDDFTYTFQESDIDADTPHTEYFYIEYDNIAEQELIDLFSVGGDLDKAKTGIQFDVGSASAKTRISFSQDIRIQGTESYEEVPDDAAQTKKTVNIDLEPYFDMLTQRIRLFTLDMQKTDSN